MSQLQTELTPSEDSALRETAQAELTPSEDSALRETAKKLRKLCLNLKRDDSSPSKKRVATIEGVLNSFLQDHRIA